MAWFKNMVSVIRHGLEEQQAQVRINLWANLAQDDINGLANAIVMIVLNEETRRICCQFVTQLIVNAEEKNAHDLMLSVFNKVAQDASQQERVGWGAGIDEILWKIRQAGQV
jgi:hypothetical protein